MEKYIIRANETFLFTSFERSFISVLLGPRRVGKTTLLEYYMSLNPDKKWVRFNMDVLSQRTRVAQEELELMIEQAALQKIGGPQKLWVFIDEAQKCPELFDQVKLLYDAHKGKNHIKFLLTGSAHLNLHKLTAESLAGRVELLNLREFNLREITLLEHNNLNMPPDHILDLIMNSKLGTKDASLVSLEENFQQIRPFQKLLEASLEQQLIWGGLPEAIEEPSDQARLKYLGDYLQTYLEKDIRAIDTIGDLNLYQNLMKISAEQTGSVRDEKKISEALHCSPATVHKYRNYLLATLQYVELFPFIASSIKRLVKSPKGYLTNNGLVSYLTGIHDFSILKTSGLIGHRFENWFLNEILTWLDTKSERHHVEFWRTPWGTEVDFVITLGKHILPFEVTYSAQIEVKKFNNLKSFLKDTPQAEFGIFCYRGPLQYDAENRILFLPAWMQ